MRRNTRQLAFDWVEAGEVPAKAEKGPKRVRLPRQDEPWRRA